MKTVLKLAALSTGVALLAYARLAYVRHYRVLSAEQALGSALEPINTVAFVLLVISVGATALFMGCMIVFLFTKKEPIQPPVITHGNGT